jgi:hypothetical protein
VPGGTAGCFPIDGPTVHVAAPSDIIGPMTYGDEIRRKLVHLSSGAFPVAYWLTDRPFMLRVLVPLVAVARTPAFER